MAYLVDKGRARYEVRESVHTAAGARSRTLVSFSVLDDGVLERARARAKSSMDTGALCRAARRIGIPVAESRADASVRVLLQELAAGRGPRPGLADVLRSALPDGPREVTGDLAHWVEVSDAERGVALVDLLRLADKLPAVRRGTLLYPQLGTP